MAPDDDFENALPLDPDEDDAPDDDAPEQDPDPAPPREADVTEYEGDD